MKRAARIPTAEEMRKLMALAHAVLDDVREAIVEKRPLSPATQAIARWARDALRSGRPLMVRA